MIVVHNRSLIIPPEEYCIGNDYDTHTDSRIFRVNRILGGIDIANLLFKLDLQYADGSADTLAMEPEIKDDYVCLLWTITKNQLQIPGTVLAQIRALNIDGKMKWTSNMGAFFVENSIFSSGNYEGKLSEIEQFEAILPAEKARAQNELKREQEFKDMKSASEKATAAANEAAKKAESYTLGDISDKTVNFNQAAELANIISGEAISIVLGKVSKAIATTMSLDQNALLKSMLSSVDVNDTNKIPTSAYIHSLVERIGMGTALNTGSNLTNAVNQLNSDLEVEVNDLTDLLNPDYYDPAEDHYLRIYRVGNVKVLSIVIKAKALTGHNTIATNIPGKLQPAALALPVIQGRDVGGWASATYIPVVLTISGSSIAMETGANASKLVYISGTVAYI